MPRKNVAFFYIYYMGVYFLKNMYNKHKTHIIYSLKLKSKKITILLMICIFNISFLFTFKIIEKNFRPTVKALAISQAKIYMTEIIDESIKNLPELYTDYSNICQINKNEAGKIISVTTNTDSVNNIKLNLSDTIIKKLSKDSVALDIPIGNLTNTFILSGRGPRIPIKIMIASAPDIHIDSNFESVGINQTKHKLSIITNIDIFILLPNDTISQRISSEVMISETIIVGEIPNLYVSK